jgi:hypothetical protein
VRPTHRDVALAARYPLADGYHHQPVQVRYLTTLIACREFDSTNQQGCARGYARGRELRIRPTCQGCARSTRHNDGMAGTFGRTRDEYGDQFEQHLLEQYKIFIETEERLVDRRQQENRFFLSVSALIVTGLSVLLEQGISDRQASVGIILLAGAGLALCFAWHSILSSYRDLNTAKFVVIAELEAKLPARMFGAEWEAAQTRKYAPFTKVEKRVPFIFGLLHAVGVGVGVLGVLGLLHSH